MYGCVPLFAAGEGIHRLWEAENLPKVILRTHPRSDQLPSEKAKSPPDGR
jgi:hypothetical protein